MNFGLSLIGAGRLGGALAIALAQVGYRIETIVSRTFESADRLAGELNALPSAQAPRVLSSKNLKNFAFSPAVLIAVPDSQIETIAQQLAALSPPANTIFLHTSGALSSKVLQSLQNVGGATGSVHPLVAVSDWRASAKNFAGAYFCLEGDAAALGVSQTIVTALKGHAFSIPTEQKSLYHAAAVMSAGHLVALFDLASETLADCGLEKTQAEQILLPLARSAMTNLERQTPAVALTGTFARADLETMRKHLEALTNKSAFKIYIELGLRSLKLAATRGKADAEKMATMRSELEDL